MADSLGGCCCVACGVVFAALLVAAFPVTQITLGAVYLHECPAGPAVPLYELVSGVATLLVISQALMVKLVPQGLLLNIFLCWVVCLSLFALAWFIFGSYHIYVIYQPSYTKPTGEAKGLNDSVYSSPDPNTGSSNLTLSLSNHTRDTDSNLTSANLTETVALGNRSSETKVLKALQVAGVMDEAPYCNRGLYLFAFWTTTLVYGFAALGLAVSACFYGCLMLGMLLASCSG